MLVGQEIFVSGQAKKAECAQRRNWDIEYKIYFTGLLCYVAQMLDRIKNVESKVSDVK